MLSFDILIPAILNGIMTGAVYALIALGLTLIYGVLHIINFAHGALLTAALFAVYFAHRQLGLDRLMYQCPLPFLGFGEDQAIHAPFPNPPKNNIRIIVAPEFQARKHQADIASRKLLLDAGQQLREPRV